MRYWLGRDGAPMTCPRIAVRFSSSAKQCRWDGELPPDEIEDFIAEWLDTMRELYIQHAANGMDAAKEPYFLYVEMRDDRDPYTASPNRIDIEITSDQSEYSLGAEIADWKLVAPMFAVRRSKDNVPVHSRGNA